MRKFLVAAAALLCLAFAPSPPANAASLVLTKPDTAHVAPPIEKVGYRYRKRGYYGPVAGPYYGGGWGSPYVQRFYAVPAYAYPAYYARYAYPDYYYGPRAYYYNAWSYPSQGVFYTPGRYYNWDRRW